jgi:multiple sugar transport system substrate-binding protein
VSYRECNGVCDSSRRATVRYAKSFLLRAGLLALLALAAAILAGCGGDSGGGGQGSAGTGNGPVKDPTEPTEITFASWVGQETTMKKFAKEFHALHPNITVKFQTVAAEELPQKLTTQIAGGNPPDAAYVDAGTVGDFAARGALVNLDDYISRSKVVKPDDYVEAFRASTVFEDSMYGLPFDGESTGLFYRTDRFQEAGIAEPPKTWEEFEADAAKLTDPAAKKYGFAVFAPAPESAYYWYPWLWQNGGDLYTADHKSLRFNDAAGKEAADFYVGLAKYAPKDFLNSNSYDGRQAFANGSVAMYVAGAWLAGTLSSEFPKIKGKWATAPLPEGKAGCATTIAGDNLVLFADADHQDAAWLWIEYISRPENMAKWTYLTAGSTLLPPRKSLLDSPEITQKVPILKGFIDAMPCGHASVIADPKWPKIEQVLSEQLGKAMYGEISGDEAVDKAAEEGQKLLEK